MFNSINYRPPYPAEILYRRCRVPVMWGKIRMDCFNSSVPRMNKLLDGYCSSPEFEAKVRPCAVRIERYQSSSSLVWDVEKVKLEDKTVQFVYRTVRTSGVGEAGEERINETAEIQSAGNSSTKKDSECDDVLETVIEKETNASKKVTQIYYPDELRNYPVELKSQVMKYCQQHSAKETCGKFGVSKSSLNRWKREAIESKGKGKVNKVNMKVFSKALKLKALKYKKRYGYRKTCKIFKISKKMLSKWDEEVTGDKVKKSTREN
eukprot:GFUD01034950.1.p1 GENE.GFUD01034950.1~~GFUD01034950.1.p1  ORF type:complete len:264 (+),score=70.03 GFUD01034950.1:34-825(+)